MLPVTVRLLDCPGCREFSARGVGAGAPWSTISNKSTGIIWESSFGKKTTFGMWMCSTEVQTHVISWPCWKKGFWLLLAQDLPVDPEHLLFEQNPISFGFRLFSVDSLWGSIFWTFSNDLAAGDCAWDFQKWRWWAALSWQAGRCFDGLTINWLGFGPLV